jgi:hypothetical protein
MRYVVPWIDPARRRADGHCMRSAKLCGWALAFLAVLSGCGGAGTERPIVRIVTSDFSIRAPRVAPAGDVRIEVLNKGPVSHEVLLVRLTGKPLPLRGDGFTIDEEAIQKARIGVIEPQRPGVESHMDVHLVPGRYLVFCNMAGHFAVGMRREFTVR